MCTCKYRYDHAISDERCQAALCTQVLYAVFQGFFCAGCGFHSGNSSSTLVPLPVHAAGWMLSRVPAVASFATPPVLLGRAQPDMHAVLAVCF